MNQDGARIQMKRIPVNSLGQRVLVLKRNDHNRTGRRLEAKQFGRFRNREPLGATCRRRRHPPNKGIKIQNGSTKMSGIHKIKLSQKIWSGISEIASVHRRKIHSPLAPQFQTAHTFPAHFNSQEKPPFMPADYTIDAERGIVFSRGSGAFTHEDYKEHMTRLAKDPLFQPKFHQLVDCRSISVMKLTGAEIESLAMKSLFDASSLRAFVASNSVQFGLSRMFGTYRKIHGGQEVMVFSELKDALVWLGLPADLDPYGESKSQGADEQS